ncbi:RsmB/NOP family class I SAM-dependent RNA methyltransferase [uncultured Maritimibacter sp.]|uniref:RsmB/NOP family class I SAM-dependent RNA methyltransferase n=1 Tax=uncultured Maritimibacter sp. TaxID=991866 RepID=UPI000AADF13E|nr:RsmB/NOP family class I SAM-dependent RNA methyltransferase [uncultured Maritimibacter sp.]
MTPAARQAAAIGILDDWLAGGAPERLLTNWARGNRYAGSGDRAAVRDIVYDAIRCRLSFAALGGADTGRGLVLGGLRAAGRDPDAVFTGERFAPAPLTEAERAGETALADLAEHVALDLPLWLLPDLRQSLGDDLSAVARDLRSRAPVFLRVHRQRTTREEAQAALAAEGIVTAPHDLADTALEVTEGARRIRTSLTFTEGLVELQDAASQAVVLAAGVTPGARVLDYCAGGGGKALAFAAEGATVTAHDIDAARMGDIPERARRAKSTVRIVQPGQVEGTFDLVFVDAPCSGSGSWRRAPQGKWLLTRDDLDRLARVQSDILDRAVAHVAPGGRLAYATCSLLDAENRDQVDAFLARHPEWSCLLDRRLTPLDGGDGFYVAMFVHNEIFAQKKQL